MPFSIFRPVKNARDRSKKGRRRNVPLAQRFTKESNAILDYLSFLQEKL